MQETQETGLIPGVGRSPGEGNGNPLQYSCLENPMDGGARWVTVHGVAESHTTEMTSAAHNFNCVKLCEVTSACTCEKLNGKERQKECMYVYN